MRRAFALPLSKAGDYVVANSAHLSIWRTTQGHAGITQHILTAQLREFEVDGLVSRTVFAEVPPRAKYEITVKALGADDGGADGLAE